MEGKVKYLNGLNINKHYIVMGNPGSGKTRLAKLMAEKLVDKQEAVIVDAKQHKGDFYFNMSSENTKLIIFDDALEFDDYIYFTEGITVNRLGKYPIVIFPKIILTSDIVNKVSPSVYKRFNLIEIL